MKKTFILILILCGKGLFAQERPSPFIAVESFFKAFHDKDSVAMQKSFLENARLMHSGGTQQGKSILQVSNLEKFIRSVATRKNSPQCKEHLGQPIIQQHLNLATVWVPFRFTLDGELSHCGYNSFTLVWDDLSWKILSLIDTGTKNCDLIQLYE